MIETHQILNELHDERAAPGLIQILSLQLEVTTLYHTKVIKYEHEIFF